MRVKVTEILKMLLCQLSSRASAWMDIHVVTCLIHEETVSRYVLGGLHCRVRRRNVDKEGSLLLLGCCHIRNCFHTINRSL